jgi:hypothetical protein
VKLLNTITLAGLAFAGIGFSLEYNKYTFGKLLTLKLASPVYAVSFDWRI